jgi:sialic acid synthase SpsE
MKSNELRANIMKTANPTLEIEGKCIGNGNPSYFIADIAANHDGDLERAKALIWMAKEAGADAAKFQHFKAESIVSDHGFRSLVEQQTHQTKWTKSVFQVYRDASVSLEWTSELKAVCDQAGITFFTSPYAFDLVDAVDPYVPAYKIGSGDITWIAIIEHIASKAKPYILATGASTMDDVERAVSAALAINPQLALMQCNTNYTGSVENMRYIQLNVLRCYRAIYPKMVLGLSDHTPGHATVLGAVALGARMVEKHFTDDVTRKGPDHAFSMNPRDWREMIDRTRELEAALGTGIKQVEDNEIETVVLQRRSIRASRNLAVGHVLCADDLTMLRPCPSAALAPYRANEILGRVLRNAKFTGENFVMDDFQ